MRVLFCEEQHLQDEDVRGDTDMAVDLQSLPWTHEQLSSFFYANRVYIYIVTNAGVVALLGRGEQAPAQ